MQSCPPLPAELPPAAAFDVRLHGCDADRDAVEAYIARRYARCHGAHIDVFMPQLLVAGQGHRHAAAVGLRPAGPQPLFLEQYLDGPVEAALAAGLRQPVERAQAVEIGNLAVSNRLAGQLLITLLIEALRGAGFRWLVFTATRPVRALVQGLGFPLETLAAADPARLGVARAAWGRYYEAEPRVMAGDLAAGVAHIRAEPSLVAMTQAHLPTLARLLPALQPAR
ncbi:MAG: thermostable hemolysin [Pseudomonadota bacterium]